MFYVQDFSYEDHLTYKVLKGDTLKSVAEKLQIDPNFLRIYHNKFCPLKDLIEADFPYDLEFVILETEESKAAKEAHREKVRFSNQDFKLPFNPAGLNKSYLAMYTFQHGEEKHSIKEEINVKWLNTDKNDYSLIAINRISKVYVDEKESKSMADELAEKTASVFYPLHVVVDTNGGWVHIYNCEEIRERWQKIKKQILKEFKGEVVNESLAEFELKIQDDDTIVKSFANDWFLRAFFNGINIEYKATLTIQNIIEFPLSQKTGDITFKVAQSILPTVDAYNLVTITQKGSIVDQRSKYDFENNLPFSHSYREETTEKAEGSYTAHYFLDPNKNVVDSLFLECGIQLEIPQKITIAISSLKDDGKLTVNSRVSLLTDEKQKESSNIFKVMWEVLTGR